jgi:hypothetical protein
MTYGWGNGPCDFSILLPLSCSYVESVQKGFRAHFIRRITQIVKIKNHYDFTGIPQEKRKISQGG